MLLHGSCERAWIEGFGDNEVVFAIAICGYFIGMRGDIDHVRVHLLADRLDDLDARVVSQPVVRQDQLRLREPRYPQGLGTVLGNAGDREAKVPNDLLKIKRDKHLVLYDEDGCRLIAQRQQRLAIGTACRFLAHAHD